MTDSSNSTEDRIVIEASLCGGKPVVVGFEGYSLEHIAEMIEAATGCSLLGPHDPRLLREHRARRVAEIRAALGRTKPARKPRGPTSAYLAALASKPGIARVERKPDGTVVVITGESSAAADINPWDEVLTNAADQKRPS